MKRDWIAEVQKINPSIFKTMASMNHSVDHNNPYHQETNGNLLGHTILVYNIACKRYPDDHILQLAALLHDIGKPFCMQLNEETKRTNFNSHESFGIFILLELLDKLNLTHLEKIRVIELVARHGDHWKLGYKNILARYDSGAYQDLFKIAICDTEGSAKLTPNDSVFNAHPQLPPLKVTTKTSQQITLLIGPPASGKSTYVKTLKTFNILSRDAILMSLAKTTNYVDAWAETDQQEVESLFNTQLTYYMQNKEDFVVDMTNMTYKTRLKFTNTKAQVHAKVFLTGLPTLLSRNENRTEKQLSSKVITNMCKRFQPPYPGEQFTTTEYIFN